MDALERDFYEERRRTWRRGAFWRGFGIAAALGVLVAAIGWGDFSGGGPHIARVTVSGLITDDVERNEMLAAIADDADVRAVILRVNSPGGTTAGSESLYDSVRVVAADKPVVAVLGEVAASGGYVAAIAADHIVGLGNTLTGSIGVIMEYPDVTGLMARLGVQMETVRSSELKAEPSPFRPTNPAARALDQALIADSYAWFRGLVGERRGLSGGDLDAVANGAVFTGRQALANRLIDAIGGERQALEWLESREPGLEALPVRDWAVESESGLMRSILGKVAASGGILREISAQTGPKLYSLGP